MQTPEGLHNGLALPPDTDLYAYGFWPEPVRNVLLLLPVLIFFAAVFGVVKFGRKSRWRLVAGLVFASISVRAIYWIVPAALLAVNDKLPGETSGSWRVPLQLLFQTVVVDLAALSAALLLGLFLRRLFKKTSRGQSL